MSAFATILTPASPTAATLFTGTLVAATQQTVIPGFKSIIGITTQGATDANAAAGVHVRFGSALKVPSATSADWFIPLGTVQYFDLGSEFDRVSIVSAGTPIFFVYVFSTKG